MSLLKANDYVANQATFGALTLNWQNATDYFFAQNWTGAVPDTTGTTPMNQIVFTGFSGSDTKWQGYDDQVTPVPEPSTYGAIFISGCLGVIGLRRYRRHLAAKAK
mgnify:CR=1 FL=1